MASYTDSIGSTKLSNEEEKLCEELKEVVENFRWQKLGRKEDFKGKTCTRFISSDGGDIVLVNLASDNGFYAMDASCSHAGGPLEMGDIEDIDGHLCLVCPWHDYAFRLDNGESSSGLQQHVYDVKVVEECVFIHSRAELIVPCDEETGEPDITPLESKTGSQPTVSLTSEIGEVGGGSLCDHAVRILCEANPQEKVRLTREAHQKWLAGELTEIGSAVPPVQPHRDEKLTVLQPGKIKRGKGGTLASRIAVLHSLANIEQWAIDLAWDIIARFSAVTLADGSSMPREFFSDFIKVAADEAKHYTILEERLHALRSSFGSLPVHNGLWQSASETNDDLLARLAVVHMVHEARGLDVHPKTQERFDRQKDQASVDVLEVIYTDEITHVAAGIRWFTYVCQHSQPPIECIPKFHELVRAHFRGHLKPPFNEKGRETAGMTKEWYMPLIKPKSESAAT